MSANRLLVMTASFVAVLLMSVGCAGSNSGKATATAKADALFRDGQKIEAARDTDRAIKRYEMALSEDPNHVPSMGLPNPASKPTGKAMIKPRNLAAWSDKRSKPSVSRQV